MIGHTIGILLGSAAAGAIGDVGASAPAATAQTDRGRDKQIEERLDRLVLVCTAMWELIQEKTSLSEEDLLAKVREVDLRDGAEDNKIRGAIAQCPQCGRTMSPRHRRCLYCGNANLASRPFDIAG